ncbi:MAG: endo alpha-1,4 polygalactosaminidase [Anaerolineae bacterium]
MAICASCGGLVSTLWLTTPPNGSLFESGAANVGYSEAADADSSLYCPNCCAWQFHSCLWFYGSGSNTEHGHTGAAMYGTDLFDTLQAVIDQLDDAGRIVICYFSAGSYEEWRPNAGHFPQEVVGLPLDDWPDERWLDSAWRVP